MEPAGVLAGATIRATANAAHDATQAKALLQQAQTLAQALGDRVAETKILWNLLLVAVLDNESHQARIDYGERALALARELDLPEQRAFILNDLWYAYAGGSQWARASEALAEARGIWRTIGNPPMLAENLMRAAISHFAAGEYERAIVSSAEAVQLSQASNNIDGYANSLGMAGRAYFECGRLGDALAAMERAVELGERVGNVTTLTGVRADLGWVYGCMGMTRKGLALAHLAQTAAQQLFPLTAAWSTAITARLHLLDGNVTEAEAVLGRMAPYREIRERVGFIPTIWGDAALAWGELALAKRDDARVIVLMDDLYASASETGVRFLLPDVLHLKGQALYGRGQTDEAYATLTRARAAAEELGSRRALWPILVTLSDVEMRRGHPGEARIMRQQVHNIVLAMANQLSDLAMRNSFLNLLG
ncbi:MAG: hypothetical protein M1546_26885, partial [Chloroflexi bacterium]|nr:hypothetical protein [Chloroflexota bacterium]